MTLTTTTETTDWPAELDAAREQTAAAAAERERIDAEYREWDDGIRQAEAERVDRRLTSGHAVELARRGYEQGLDARQHLLATRDQMRVAIGEMQAVEPELLAITGSIDGQAIVVDPLLEELKAVLERLDGLEPARIAVLTPYVDEEPLVVRTPAGWSRVNMTGEVEPDLQPGRIERPS